MVGLDSSLQPICAQPTTTFHRMPSSGGYTGDQICALDQAGVCVSSGRGSHSYKFCGTEQFDATLASYGVECFTFTQTQTTDAILCPAGQVMVGVQGSNPICTAPVTQFYRFPVARFLSGDQVCALNGAGPCVSQGFGSNNYLFCGTSQIDFTGESSGVYCLNFTGDEVVTNEGSEPLSAQSGNSDGTLMCPSGNVLTGLNNSNLECAQPVTRFYRFPTDGEYTGDQVCALNGAGPCVSQGYGHSDYLFCGTSQFDPTGSSAGVNCLTF